MRSLNSIYPIGSDIIMSTFSGRVIYNGEADWLVSEQTSVFEKNIMALMQKHIKKDATAISFIRM